MSKNFLQDTARAQTAAEAGEMHEPLKCRAGRTALRLIMAVQDRLLAHHELLAGGPGNTWANPWTVLQSFAALVRWTRAPCRCCQGVRDRGGPANLGILVVWRPSGVVLVVSVLAPLDEGGPPAPGPRDWADER